MRRLEEVNKKLSLELEHEKGKLTGLGQSHNALREHANILETALAKREADLVQLNLQVIPLAPELAPHFSSSAGRLGSLSYSNYCLNMVYIFLFFPPWKVQAVLKRKEEEDEQMRQLIQSLQTALEKEKVKVQDLKEQVRRTWSGATHSHWESQ